MIGFVRNVARMKLSDDGLRSLSKGTDASLDRDYKGWRDPQRTTMVPPVFSKTKTDRGIEAEKKIFQLLSSFTQEPMFVVHDFKFEELIDGDTVKGDHDFAIIHRRQGLILFQVKASERIDNKYHAALDQLNKDYQVTDFSLRTMAGEQLPDLAPFCRRYAVMPNCPRPEDPNVMGLFQQDCEDVASFSAWWEGHISGTTMDFPQELYEHLIRRFVGRLHIQPHPSNQMIVKTFVMVEKATRKQFPKVEFATKQQLEALKIRRPKMWVTGPAGSGKTWLLLQQVHHLASTGRPKILVLCYHKPLSLYLGGQLWQLTGVGTATVMTYDKFLLNYLHIPVGSPKREKIAAICKFCLQPANQYQYHHIFVDEGQDLYGPWHELLEHFLKKEDSGSNVESPHFWVMYDANQHVQPTANHQGCYQQQLQESLKLENILRNPRKIFELSRKFFSDVLGLFQNLKLGHKISGPDVLWDNSLSGDLEEDAKKLAMHVGQLHNEKNVPLDDICILTEEQTARDNLINELGPALVPCQNAEQHIEDNRDAVVVESIRRFKGLESRVVILFDPVHAQTPPEWVSELLYVAMSRCNCFLIIFSTEEICKCIKENSFAHWPLTTLTPPP